MFYGYWGLASFLAAEFRPVAAAQVRRELVLSAVAEARGHPATESEVDARVVRIAESRGVPAGQVYASLQQAKRLAELERTITEEKVFEFKRVSYDIDASAQKIFASDLERNFGNRLFLGV